MKLAYFARPISAYNTPQDIRDTGAITELGFHVVEITNDLIAQAARTHGMSYFKDLVQESDVLFFRAFPDERISAGVGQEIAWAQEEGIPVFEMPGELEGRVLDVSQTRRMLQLCGLR